MSLPSRRDVRALSNSLQYAELELSRLREALGAAEAGTTAALERCASLEAELDLARVENNELRAASASLSECEARCAGLAAEVTSARAEQDVLRARIMSLARQLHLLRPERVNAATSPIAAPAAGAPSPPAPSSEQRVGATYLAPASSSATWAPRASSPLRVIPPLSLAGAGARAVHRGVLVSLVPTTALTARQVWEAWCALGKPSVFDAVVFSEASKGPFQRYKSLARVVGDLQGAGAADPIGVLDSYLYGKHVYVCGGFGVRSVSAAIASLHSNSTSHPIVLHTPLLSLQLRQDPQAVRRAQGVDRCAHNGGAAKQACLV
jgi:hypothetical protein